jgi:hypothetical protein
LKISEEVLPKIFDNIPQLRVNGEWESGIQIKAEFYLHRNNLFYPMYRYDSNVAVYGRLPKKANFYLTTAFIKASKKIFDINIEDVLSKRKPITLEELNSRNNENFELTILNTGQYKKGAYRNFEEFKNNAPSISFFEFKKGEMGDILYIKENGEEYPSRNVWGFSDGTVLYINSGNKFSQLIKVEKTFYFKGIKRITRKTVNSVFDHSLALKGTGASEMQTTFSADYKYYQVDMETGEAY